MSIFLIISAIVIYLVIGAARVASDYRQPMINQPAYVRDSNLRLTLIFIITWPLLVLGDTLFFYRYYKANCTSKGLQRIVDFFKTVVLHRRCCKKEDIDDKS